MIEIQISTSNHTYLESGSLSNQQKKQIMSTEWKFLAKRNYFPRGATS